jgi:hypothetical protein
MFWRCTGTTTCSGCTSSCTTASPLQSVSVTRKPGEKKQKYLVIEKKHAVLIVFNPFRMLYQIYEFHPGGK